MLLVCCSCLLRLCCFVASGRFWVFAALFAPMPLCLTLQMQCLGDVSAYCFFFFVFSFFPPVSAVSFFLLLSPPCHTCEIWAIRGHMTSPKPTSRVPLHQIAPLRPSEPFVGVGDLPVLCVCLWLRVCIMLVLVFVLVCVARAF